MSGKEKHEAEHRQGDFAFSSGLLRPAAVLAAASCWLGCPYQSRRHFDFGTWVLTWLFLPFFSFIPRLAVRLALRNQVARGRSRSSHVVFTFAESLDVCRDFTRSQRRRIVWSGETPSWDVRLKARWHLAFLLSFSSPQRGAKLKKMIVCRSHREARSHKKPAQLVFSTQAWTHRERTGTMFGYVDGRVNYDSSSPSIF